MSPSSKIRWCQCVEVRELHHDDSLDSLSLGSLIQIYQMVVFHLAFVTWQYKMCRLEHLVAVS
jgi:hypothetical protein